RSRMRHATLLTLLTAACAAGAPGPGQAPSGPSNQAGPASSNPGPATPGTAAGTQAAPIQGGRSEVSSRPFTVAAGVLDPDIEAFAEEVARVRSLPLAHVRGLLLEARYNATAARLMAPAQTRIRRSWVRS